MEFDKPRIEAGLTQSLRFDEQTGVLAVGWTMQPDVNLGSKLAYQLTAAEAVGLAAALTAFAANSKR